MNHTLFDTVVLVPALRAASRDDALAEVLDRMAEAGVVEEKAREGIYQQLVVREDHGSTGLGNGVAVPHVKETDVGETRIAVAISAAGIPFDAIDGKPVHILFLVLGAAGAPPEDHLQTLRWVSGLARNTDFRRFAPAVDGPEALRDLLVEMSEC
ncbi:MAG: PTS sugar transporter subunit IIA [Planctomycetota bacterium]|nr:PTS sugar transporter subunit IIA [Planctomycetota bacterium]